MSSQLHSYRILGRHNYTVTVSSYITGLYRRTFDVSFPKECRHHGRHLTEATRGVCAQAASTSLNQQASRELLLV